MVGRKCKAEFKISKNCGTPKTNNINSEKHCCAEFDKNAHLPGKKCKINENCFGRFSPEHHKLFCAKRIKGKKLFLLIKKPNNI